MIEPIRLAFEIACPAESWRDRNHGGWATLLPWFVAAAEAPRPA